MVRLAAFDMDGTLLMPNHHLGDETLTVLERLRNERQVTLVFATGRHVLEMRHVLDALNLDAYLITGNGTRIHSRDGQLMHGSDLPAEVAERVIHREWKTSASMHVFNDRGWFTEQVTPELLAAHVFSGFKPQDIDLRSIPPNEVTKVVFCGTYESLCDLSVELTAELGDSATLCFSAAECLEVLPLGANKGTALSKLSSHLDIKMHECMAFGDAMNDREMLSSVGRGLIMGNAMPQLKIDLPHLSVIGHCADQAVAQYLTSWLDTPHLTDSPEY